MTQEKLILEPVTKDTILCNQIWFKEAKRWYLEEKDNFDYSPDDISIMFKNFGPDISWQVDYPLTLEQHHDILPWIIDWFDYALEALEKIEQFIERDHAESVEEYCSSEDYASNYCPDNLEYSDELKEFIFVTLEKLVPAIAEKLSEDKDRWWDLLKVMDLEIRTGNMYDCNFNNFIIADSFNVGEYEDQIEVSSLENIFDLDPKDRETTIAFIEYFISDGVRSKDTKYPYFYLYVNTDIFHNFGWTHEHIETVISSDLTPEEYDAGNPKQED